MSNIDRTPQFKRNEALESLLSELNKNLWVAEKKIISEHRSLNYPVIFIMGPLRSGTTLFLQWLSQTGIVSYPTNLLSRFYGSPILGAKIQLLLTHPRYNFRNELGEFTQPAQYASENGKTMGALSPNEFWYFWRRFLPDSQRDVWSYEELKAKFDVDTMIAEIGGIMDVFEKPFAAKGMIFNYHIPFLNEVFSRVIFVQIKRNPILNVQSVLSARERQLGNKDKWYSFEIPEYSELIELSAIEQVSGQVASINRAIDISLSSLPEEKKMVVSYEMFCESPENIYNLLVKKINQQGYHLEVPYSGVNGFTPVKDVFFSTQEIDIIQKTYFKYYSR